VPKWIFQRLTAQSRTRRERRDPARLDEHVVQNGIAACGTVPEGH
jgi:hypothetical protein